METSGYRRLLILALSIAIGLFCLQPMAEAQRVRFKMPKYKKTSIRPTPQIVKNTIIGLGIVAESQHQSEKKQRTISPLTERSIHPRSIHLDSVRLLSKNDMHTKAMSELSRYRQMMEREAELRANFALRHRVTRDPFLSSIVLKPKRLPKEMLSLPKLSGCTAMTVSTNLK